MCHPVIAQLDLAFLNNYLFFGLFLIKMTLTFKVMFNPVFNFFLLILLRIEVNYWPNIQNMTFAVNFKWKINIQYINLG